MSFSWFSCGSSILVELEFGKSGCRGRRKTGEHGENPSGQGENQQQTQPTYGTWSELNPGPYIGVEASALTTAPSLLPIRCQLSGAYTTRFRVGIKESPAIPPVEHCTIC